MEAMLLQRPRFVGPDSIGNAVPHILRRSNGEIRYLTDSQMQTLLATASEVNLSTAIEQGDAIARAGHDTGVYLRGGAYRLLAVVDVAIGYADRDAAITACRAEDAQPDQAIHR